MSTTDQKEENIKPALETETVSAPTALTQKDQSAKTNIIICYVLFLASFLTGITFFAAGIWAYLKRDEAIDTPFADHYNTIIRTFWTCIILSIVGFITWIVFIGVFIVLFASIYLLWKSIKGLSRITSDKAYN